jgi:hypothetical protein
MGLRFVKSLLIYFHPNRAIPSFFNQIATRHEMISTRFNRIFARNVEKVTVDRSQKTEKILKAFDYS